MCAESLPRRRRLTVDDYVQGVLEGNRAVLAQTITLVESNARKHKQTAQEVLRRLLPYTGNSIRIGITGVPGAGKSTLIDTFGHMLCEDGHRVAVLAVDPSSTLTGGSILGDKTRMENLSRNQRAFVRPSPSGGTLGGVTRKTRETLLICEAAGFDVILVETVGVGQSEIAVRSMVDFFLVLLLTGAGDDLQGMKKGIMEIADAIFVNKADGANKRPAQKAKAELNRVLHFLQPATEGWTTKAYTCSALTGEGIDKIWDVIQRYKQTTMASGVFDERRRRQTLEWMEAIIEEQLKTRFYEDRRIQRLKPAIEQEVIEGKMSAAMAADKLLQALDKNGGIHTQEQKDNEVQARPAQPKKIAHIGIAVRSLEEALPVYTEQLGMVMEGIETVESEQVRVAFLKIGQTRIELLEPTSEASPIAHFIHKKGTGIHHLAVEVDDLEDRLEQLKKNGIRLINEQPKDGAHGAQIAFLHPKSTGGTLLELCQYTTGHAEEDQS